MSELNGASQAVAACLRRGPRSWLRRNWACVAVGAFARGWFGILKPDPVRQLSNGRRAMWVVRSPTKVALYRLGALPLCTLVRAVNAAFPNEASIQSLADNPGVGARN